MVIGGSGNCGVGGGGGSGMSGNIFWMIVVVAVV